MTKDTAWRGSWRKSKGAPHYSPETQAEIATRDAAWKAEKAARAAARALRPEPVYVPEGRLAALEAAAKALADRLPKVPR
ncbi:MAG: hypothetical protein ACLP36_04475 [Acidimicrobiales bacterium]